MQSKQVLEEVKEEEPQLSSQKIVSEFDEDVIAADVEMSEDQVPVETVELEAEIQRQ